MGNLTLQGEATPKPQQKTVPSLAQHAECSPPADTCRTLERASESTRRGMTTTLVPPTPSPPPASPPPLPPPRPSCPLSLLPHAYTLPQRVATRQCALLVATCITSGATPPTAFAPLLGSFTFLGVSWCPAPRRHAPPPLPPHLLRALLPVHCHLQLRSPHSPVEPSPPPSRALLHL